MSLTQKVYQGVYFPEGMPDTWTLLVVDHDWRIEAGSDGVALMVQEPTNPVPRSVLNPIPPTANLVTGDSILIPAMVEGSVTDITWNAFEIGFDSDSASYDSADGTLTVSTTALPVPAWPGTPWESSHTRRDGPLSLTFKNVPSAPPLGTPEIRYIYRRPEHEENWDRWFLSYVAER